MIIGVEGIRVFEVFILGSSSPEPAHCGRGEAALGESASSEDREENEAEDGRFVHVFDLCFGSCGLEIRQEQARWRCHLPTDRKSSSRILVRCQRCQLHARYPALVLKMGVNSDFGWMACTARGLAAHSPLLRDGLQHCPSGGRGGRLVLPAAAGRRAFS
jgi:hypothetical protein